MRRSSPAAASVVRRRTAQGRTALVAVPMGGARGVPLGAAFAPIAPGAEADGSDGFPVSLRVSVMAESSGTAVAGPEVCPALHEGKAPRAMVSSQVHRRPWRSARSTWLAGTTPTRSREQVL